MKESKNPDIIKAPCPKCGCPAEEIEYYNCGPIVRLRCPRCASGVNETKAWKSGFTGSEGLFEYWNQLERKNP